MFRSIVSLLLAVPYLLFSAYEIEPLPMKGSFDDLIAASPSGHLVVQENISEPKRLGLRTYLYTPGKSPILIEPDKNVQIFEADVNSDGFVAGSYRGKGDSPYSVKLFIFNSRTRQFLDFPLPFPQDWEIEEVEFVKVTEAGEVYGRLFLDMTHDDDYFVDASAQLFEGELINFSYNVHSKETRYFLKSGVYTLNKKKKLEKLQKGAWENSLTPLAEPRHYRIGGMNDQYFIYGEKESGDDEEFSVTPFLWSPKDGFQPLASGRASPFGPRAFNNRGFLLYNTGTDCRLEDPYLYSGEKGIISIPAYGAFEAFAASLNDHNQVVGRLFFKNIYGTHAFIWDQESGIQDLAYEDPDLIFTEALHISNDGSIIVLDQEQCLYILHPVEEQRG